MDEKMTEKRRPILTIVTAILFGAFLVASIAMVYIVFARSSLTTIWFVVSFVVALGVATLVLTIISKKDRIKKAFIPFLIGTLVLAQIDGIVVVIALFQQSVEESRLNAEAAAIAKATIDKAKDSMPEKWMSLHTLETDESDFDYFDADGEIVKQFKAIEFEHMGSGSYNYNTTAPTGPVYFVLSSKMRVIFNEQFTSVRVYLDLDRGFMSRGPFSAWNSYSIKPEDGASLKKKVFDEIASQQSAYESRKAEVEEELVFPLVLDAFREGEQDLALRYHDNTDSSVGTKQIVDGEKKMLETFENLDASLIKSLETGTVYGKKGFTYWSKAENPYFLHYCFDDRCLAVERRYEDPFGSTRSARLYYSLTEEQDALLLDTVTGLVNKPVSASR